MDFDDFKLVKICQYIKIQRPVEVLCDEKIIDPNCNYMIIYKLGTYDKDTAKNFIKEKAKTIFGLDDINIYLLYESIRKCEPSKVLSVYYDHGDDFVYFMVTN